MQRHRLKIYLTVKLIKRFTKIHGYTPSKSYLDKIVNIRDNSLISIKFNGFILSFKNLIFSPNSIFLFYIVFSTKCSLSYMIYFLLVKIKQKVNGIYDNNIFWRLVND